MVQLLELNRSNYSEPLIELYWTSQIGVYRKKYHSSKYFDLYRSQLRSEHSDRVVQSTDRTVLNTPIEWLYWALRSSSCTVLNTSIELYSELYRAVQNTQINRSNCSELFRTVLNTPIEWLYWALRSSSCTVLNTSDPNIKHSDRTVQNIRSKPHSALYSSTELYRTLRSELFEQLRTLRSKVPNHLYTRSNSYRTLRSAYRAVQSTPIEI